jgi:hypothetical protein
MVDFSPKRSARPLAVVALLLAGGWLLAGALFKLTQGSPALLPAFMRELPLSLETLYPIVIGIELAVVASAWLRPSLGWLVLAGQYTVFFGVLALQIAAGEESCGCMGSKVSLTPWQMLGIDGTLFALLMFSRPWSGLPRGGAPLPLLGLVVAGLLALPWFGGRGQAVDPGRIRAAQGSGAREVVAPEGANAGPEGEQSPGAVNGGDASPGGGATAGEATPDQVESPASVPSQGWTVLDPRKWVGQDVFSIDAAEWLGEETVAMLPFDGLWVFYRQQCDHCRDHLLELANSEQGQRQVGLIRVPEASDTPDNSVILLRPEGPHVFECALPAGVDYVLSTPADATVAGGVVVDARENIQAGH